MTQRTSVGSSQWLAWQTLFLLNVSLVVFLLNCLLATRTLFIVLAIATLSNQVRSHRAHLDPLAAFRTNSQHWTGVEVVHVFVVLLNESFIDSFAKLTNLVLVNNACCFAIFLWNLDELIPHFQFHLVGSSSTSCLPSFWFYWSIIKILRFLSMTCLIDFIFNRFDNWRSQIFQIRL